LIISLSVGLSVVNKDLIRKNGDNKRVKG